MQVLVNGVMSGGSLLLLAASFLLIYRTARFFHFAHGAVFTAGAYMALSLHRGEGLPLGVSCLLAVLGSGLLGCLMDACVYCPLRARHASQLMLLLASLGLYIVCQNGIAALYGDDVHRLQSSTVMEGMVIAGAHVTLTQVAVSLVSLALTAVLALALGATAWGKVLRAVASESELAAICGIRSERVVRAAFAVGSGLAGAAGILASIDIGMTPTMGMGAFMMAVVSVVVGGSRSVVRVALAAILIGVARHSAVWFASACWQDVTTFTVLTAFLLARAPDARRGSWGKGAV